jgi:hypothetical protein
MRGGRLVTVRGFHLGVGICTVVAFLVTGQLMRHHTPPMADLTDAARLMFRSRHIYILGAGLVNLVLGVYFERRKGGWRRAIQTAASVLLLAAPVLLIAAFALEPNRGFHEEMWWSHAGLYALFGGSLLHLVSGVRG